MFTGIVEAIGVVTDTRELQGARRIVFRAPEVVAGLAPGDSVAVDGACLTAVELLPDGFAVDAIGTTLSRTVAGRYGEGSRVNLERAVKVGDRLDGHMVQGHVDGVGTVRGVQPRGEYRLVDLDMPAEVEEVTILHGSITINGVSMTVNALPEAGVCQVAVIPHTWKVTNFGDLGPGDPVNLEGDLIGKYVGKMLRPHLDRLAMTAGGSRPSGDSDPSS